MSKSVLVEPKFGKDGILDFPFLIDGEISEIVTSGNIHYQNFVVKITYPKIQQPPLYYEVKVKGVKSYYLANVYNQNIITDTYYQSNEDILKNPDETLKKFAITHEHEITFFKEIIERDALCLLEFLPTIGAHIIFLCKSFEFFSIEV
ncbi:MAG: hypothetical protein EOP04_06340 [Proteobacteria bacterium]|nr:MAG: hypothetical protein EOP04_06340 [Pseudomonadota bacterium]